MIVMALVFGTAAVFAGQRWLDRQSSRLRDMQVVAKPVSTQKVVVAAIPFGFGTEITREHLREIDWPQGAIPRGAFASAEEILDGRTRRVALSGIEENEPILKTKLTGPGQRASLAAVIQDGMKAVTVRVNDVAGVAGFVLPGERVDILLTRSLEREDAYADVLLQNVKVLAIDQSADERSDKPSIVKAVTLEVNTGQAQKLTLAGTVGTLSLALRAAGAAEVEPTQRIAINDLARPTAAPVVPPNAAFVSMKTPDAQRTVAVGVTRALKRQEYSVPVQPAGLETASPAKRPELPKTATIASP
jgi:pilus assembly protein CpaB